MTCLAALVTQPCQADQEQRARHSATVPFSRLFRDPHAYVSGSAAVEIFDNTEFDSALIRVQPVVRDPNARRERQSQGNIYVGNLPNSRRVDSGSLGDSFRHWGKVISSRVCYTEGKPTHGFVQFEDPLAAVKAIQEVTSKY